MRFVGQMECVVCGGLGKAMFFISLHTDSLPHIAIEVILAEKTESALQVASHVF